MEEHLATHYGVAVQYGSESIRLTVGEAKVADEWPVHLKLVKDGRTHCISAKYAVGADGAHSWTRKQAGIQMDISATGKC